VEHDALVFEALGYRRHVGADLASVRAYVGVREGRRHTSQQDRAALRRLEAAGRAVRVGRLWFLSPEAYRQARGQALAPRWQPEDPWVLLALVYSRGAGPCGLEQVIAAADFINHAIPMPEEMHGALNRLAAGGLIRSRGGRFAATAKALALFARVEATCARRVPDQLDGLGRLLNCPCCGARLKSVRWRIRLDTAEWRQACSRYRDSAPET
jgi:hypothetical protein